MTFMWPNLLWLLAGVPVVIAAYWWLLRRKKQMALRYASLGLVKAAAGGAGFRRHVPPVLFLLALIVMIGGIARPAAVVTLPSQHETVILAMDVSGSMRATDVEPNRITAAQTAAKQFINDQPSSARIGIVTFAGSASLVQPPTQSKEDLIAAIDRMQLQRATAIGSGILVSLKAIFPDVEFDLRGSNPRPEAQKSRPIDKAGKDKDGKDVVKPVPPGSYQAAAIILL